MSVKDVLDILRFLFDLLEAAFNGDKESKQKLRDILPLHMHTDLVADEQDDLDEAKFGRRDNTPTTPGRRG